MSKANVKNDTNKKVPVNEEPKQVKKVEVSVKRLDVPEEKLAEYKDAFDMFDKDHSGEISVKELAGLFRALGHNMTDSEIKDLIDSVDTDGSGEVSFDEFVTLLLKVESSNESEEDEVIKAFKVFDRDGNGSLSCAEFKHILLVLGNRFTEEEVNEIFKEADLDGDGKIDYQEFVNFWKSK